MTLGAAPPLGLFGALLPAWPLLGAAAVGLSLATGRLRRAAHLAVVAGCALSVASAAAVFLHVRSLPPRTTAPDWTAAHVATQATDADVGAGGAHAVDPGRDGAAPDAADRAHAPGRASHDAAVELSATHRLARWISLGAGQWIELNYFVDPLAAVMLLTVTVVSLMVVVYSIGYMRDHHGRPERGYERFFAFLGLFVFSMCTLVLAGNFVLLYLGWELVGLCSYLLIGFYYERPAAAAAAKKAFIVNRIGDFGFALGIFALYAFIRPHCAPGQNALDYEVVFAHVRAGALSAGEATLVALLLFCGAVGKSAQFPLYVWLPDAMEGPTPVSALIHAATMVTAGVYMVARCGVIFCASPLALDVICAVGGLTALLAATMATAQFDMKRILAYSTISQLAFMFVGLGAGAPASATFHLYTHAFFKALLFLCAGSVMHAMGGVIDLRRFAGLRRVLPHTARLTLIGCLALAGFPLLSGFFSKDEILHAAFQRSPALGALMLATAALTAYYTFRMYFLCFHGPKRLPVEAGEHPHEAPPVMLAPLALLAAGAVFAGYVGVSWAGGSGAAFLGMFQPHGAWHRFLEGSTLVSTAPHEAASPWLMYLSGALAIGGAWLAWLRFGEAPRIDPDELALGRLWRLWHAKYWVDEIYDRAIVRPLRRLGSACFSADVHAVDGAVDLCGRVPIVLGAALRLVQRGSIQAYAMGMLLGVAALLGWWLYVASPAPG